MDENQVISVYAAYSINEEERLNSSSGGLFSLLARNILSRGGIVYGVAMTEDCKAAEFIRITDLSGLAKLRGSKYLQAYTGKIFKQIKTDLDNNRTVLFSGTGCHVNGLKGFLGKDYNNLFCVDVVCHGTPSPALWRKYVDYVENKNSAHLVHINFRCKSDSWTNFGMHEIDDRKRNVYISKNEDSYMIMFLKNYSLRPSCFECKAKKTKQSDLTIADFWGIDSVAPEMNDGKGTSLVLVRTNKGEALFDELRGEVKLEQVSYSDGVKCNSAEYCSVNRPLERESFFTDMERTSYEELQAKYAIPTKTSLKQKAKSFIKKILISANVIVGMKNRLIGGGGGHKTSIGNYGLLFTFEYENGEK